LAVWVGNFGSQVAYENTSMGEAYYELLWTTENNWDEKHERQPWTILSTKVQLKTWRGKAEGMLRWNFEVAWLTWVPTNRSKPQSAAPWWTWLAFVSAWLQPLRWWGNCRCHLMMIRWRESLNPLIGTRPGLVRSMSDPRDVMAWPPCPVLQDLQASRVSRIFVFIGA
jgi:hypothetical protein